MRSIGEDGIGWPKDFFPKDIGKNCVVGYPYCDHRMSTPTLLAGGLFVFLCIHYAVEWYWCLPGAMAFLLLACSLSKQAIVDTDEKRVIVFFRLYLKCTLKTESFPFSEFRAIRYTWHDCADEWPTKRVGLEHENARRLWVRAFSCDGAQAKSSRGAESFAWRLSCDTGIPIDEKLVKTVF